MSYRDEYYNNDNEIHYQYVGDESVDLCEILANASESSIKSDIEKQLLAEYQVIFARREIKKKKLRELNELIYLSKGVLNILRRIKFLYKAKQVKNNIKKCDEQLFELMETKPLKDILDREKTILHEKSKQELQERSKAVKERQKKQFEEMFQSINERYETSRKEALAKRAEMLAKQPKEIITNEIFSKLFSSHKEWMNGNKNGKRLVIEYKDFSTLNLQGLRLQNSIIRNCVFEKMDLTKTSFRKCDLTNCIFKKCILNETDFTNAILTDVKFEKTSTENAIINLISLN